MEVIGLVAAVPGLIEITQKTISVIRAFIDQNLFVKQITELLDQLELIEKILHEILSRLKSSTIHHSNFHRLTTVTRSLKDELIGLRLLFQPLTAGPGRTTRALHRVRLLICGLERKIKKYHEQLDKAKSALMLVIIARNAAIVEENLRISRSNLRLKVNEVLLPCEYNFIPQNLQGTCEWIWSHAIFNEWLKDAAPSSPVGHEHRIMCIYGPKGCGKSVLAASIVHKLKSQAKLAIGFSFWAGSHSQRELLAFLRTFLWHVVQQIPDDNLAQISTPLLESLPLTEKTLEDVILIAAKSIKSPIYCIIDGIDESVDDWARPDAGGLRLVFDLAKTHANLRVVLLGRDASMRTATSLTPLRIEVTEELIRPDINQLILYHLDSSLKIQDVATRQLVEETLQESSRVMFLWVTLIFGELKRCQLPCEIIRTLHQVPRDLDREYHRLFVCLQDRLGGARNSPSLSMERAKCLLTWIIAAPEPLTLEELRCAFAISQCPDDGYEQNMISDDGIMDTCGDFVRVSNGRYHIAHASIVEFLTRPIELWKYEDETIDYFHIDVSRGQSLMCLGCIKYFQRVDLCYPLVDTSVAMSHLNRPIFSCALKFLLIYTTASDEPEHYKRAWEYFQGFMRTPQFCCLVEYLLFILKHESAVSPEQHAEVLKFICWAYMTVSLDDQLPIARSVLETRFKKELARREKMYGPDHDRSRTWKAVVDIFIVTSEDGQTTVAGPHDVVSSNHFNRQYETNKVEPRRNAENSAMLKIGDMIVAKTPVIQTLVRVVPKFTSLVPKLLPIPFVVLRALLETDQVLEEQYWSSAVERLAGANNFLEAYCTFQLGICRFDKYTCDETVKGLLNRSRQVATSLPASLHADVLLCSTLTCLIELLVDHNEFLEAQAIVSELQQRLSSGPTKGYISTRMERKLYRPLFWDDWKAKLLADIAKEHARKWTATCHATAVSIVDSNIQLYKDPGHRRVESSIIAHCAKAEALSRQWLNGGSKIPCELANSAEAACREALRLARFPNLSKYTSEQWVVLETLLTILYGQHRHHEAKELLSRIVANFLPTTCEYSVTAVAATAACLGDFETSETLLKRAGSTIQGQQASLLPLKCEHITNLITALTKVRPIVKLWLLVSLCHRFCNSIKISKFVHEQDFWYIDAMVVHLPHSFSFQELWDIFYIRYLALTDNDNYTRNAAIYLRRFEHEVPDYENYENDSGDEEGNSGHKEEASENTGIVYRRYTGFAFGCEEFAFTYARKQNYKAAAVVSRYLISYALQRKQLDSFQWSLYYLAISLHFEFRSQEALALCGSMLLRADNHVSCQYKLWSYLNIGIVCFKIGDDHEANQNPLSAEFFKLAGTSFERVKGARVPTTEIDKILRWHNASRVAVEVQDVTSLEPTALPQVYPNIRYRDGFPKHQSCPDLRARYLKEALSHRYTYGVWRKFSIKSNSVG